jgi:hypothetical protein
MSDALFYDRAVLKVIRAILVSTGIRGEQDLEDGIGEVVLACIEHVRSTGRPPKDVAEAIAIARPIAGRDAVDAARMRARRRKSNEGSTAEADAHAGAQPRIDPVEQERVLGIVGQVLKDHEIEALSDLGAGVAHKELAAERGTSPAAMRKRVQKSRKTVLSALSARGYAVAGGFATLLAVMVAVYVSSRSVPDARPRPTKELAGEQRRLAAGACKEGKWDACEKALDEAARLDSEGERGAEVKALREAVAAGRRGTGVGDGGGPDAGRR